MHLQPPAALPAFLTAGAVAFRPWPGCHHPVPLHQPARGPHLQSGAPAGPALPAGGQPKGTRPVIADQQRNPAGQRTLLLPSGGPGARTRQLRGQDGNQTESGGYLH